MILGVGTRRPRAGPAARPDSAYQHALAIFRRDRAETHIDIRRVHDGLATLHAAWGHPTEAARHRALAEPPG